MTDKELLTIANHIGIMVCSTYHHGRTNTNGIDNDQKTEDDMVDSASNDEIIVE